MTQEELRKLYNERLVREKQVYIAKVTHINQNYLSQFRKGKIELFPQMKILKFYGNSSNKKFHKNKITGE